MQKKTEKGDCMEKRAILAALLLAVSLAEGCTDRTVGDTSLYQPTSSLALPEKSSPLAPLSLPPASSLSTISPQNTENAAVHRSPLSAGEEAEQVLSRAVFSSTADDGQFTYALYDCYAAVTGFSPHFSAQGETVSLNVPELYEALPVRVIDTDAFSAAHGIFLSSVLLPRGLWRIEARAFLDQHYLSGVLLPDSILYVGEDAFVCRDRQGLHAPALTLNQTIFISDGKEIVNEKRFDVSR